MTKRRVVVTGIGMLTPLGLDVATSWQNILAGKSGVGPLTRIDSEPFSVKIAAEVKNFDPTPYMDHKDIRKLDTFIQFAIAAASQALKDAGIDPNPPNAERIGVTVGSGMGGLPNIEKNLQASWKGGPRRILPTFIPGAIINMAPGMIAIKYGLKGPNISVVTACGTGSHNIAVAARLIAYGDSDVMVAGGAEMSTTVLGIGGFAAARVLSKRNDEPEKASRPWDRDRDGFVLGEGAGIMVLEEYEHAKARGAKIYAELAGIGMAGDAHHMTTPDPCGAGSVAAMQAALKDAQLNIDEIQHINAHATSTPLGDGIEADSVKQLFGEHAYKIPISATKSMTGHLLGATGSVEAIFTVLALRDQIAPPTINLDNPSEGCDLNFVPHVAQDAKMIAAMSNSFGFGGTTVSLIFRKI